ncbi:uncharacterized protein LOC112269742 [Brachypodium distachyon]|uniref:uncharacterized protein LOC112269742 n=1 Tax=Brachypodium distachyon TaxID=15368 RepID=UPI000D0D827F|nr:uncharacterized protein LOC112269742 [Brachypodium distachyon]|eukprot:XP_024312540.1 uncharacterized protein LOC112269742 [Brachypodium distachyon]
MDQMELQLLSTVDPTTPMEDELFLDIFRIRRQQEERGLQRRRRYRRRLSFALAVRQGRFARYSLLIRSRYGVWSAAERRFIRKTNFYHYHHLTKGIRDLRELYHAARSDVGAVSRFREFLYRLLVVNLRRAMLAESLYYYAFLLKDRRMEWWPDEYGGEAKREELSLLRHAVADAYLRRVTVAQRLRVRAAYKRDLRHSRWTTALSLCLTVFFGWLLRRELARLTSNLASY